MNNIRWRKSSRTGPNGDCVELASDFIHIRDSKHPDGPKLTVNVHALITAVHHDRFNH